jgi:hypothetical protein
MHAAPDNLDRYTDVAADYALEMKLDGTAAQLTLEGATDLKAVVVRSQLLSLDRSGSTTLPDLAVGDVPAGKVSQTSATWSNLPATGIIEQAVYAGERLLGRYELPLPMTSATSPTTTATRGSSIGRPVRCPR